MATLHEITKAVAYAFGFTAGDLQGPSRARPVAHARFAAYLIARETHRFSFPRIGDFFGHRHHTGVMAGASKAKQMLQNDEYRSKYYHAKIELGMTSAPIFKTTRKDRT